ncbi:MAG: AraC family transcriptional regulator [Litorimonas sp.]
MTTYQSVYPSEPLLRATDHLGPRAAEVLNLEYFEADPDSMPTETFSQHHLLFNLKEEPHRVENFRDGQHRDFTFRKDEIVITPAGVKSGWRWHARSRCIVVTIDPALLDRFAKTDVGVLLETAQIKSEPQIHDPELTSAAMMLRDALADRHTGFEVIYESMARVFLVKLLQRYGLERDAAREYGAGFTAEHYKRVLDFVDANYSRSVTIEDLAAEAGLSTAHFSRLFKETVGETPYRFLTLFRVERARDMLNDPARPMVDIALACGFSDQAHFSRTFAKVVGMPPSVFRKTLIRKD